MTSADARALAGLAEKHERVLMVGHTFEYNPSGLENQGCSDGDELGSIYYLYSNRVNLGKCSAILTSCGASPRTIFRS